MSESPPSPMFIADAPGLDFLNSLAVPVDTKVEWIGSGDDFLAWLGAAKLVPDDILAEMRRKASPGELDAAAQQARKLREWFRGFVQAHIGRPLKPHALDELEPLNRILQRDEVFSQVVARETPRKGKAKRSASGEAPRSGLVWSTRRRWRSADSLLLPIAQEIARLVCEEDFTHVRRCEGAGCVLVFLDRTRARARRWCSMAVCGNRAKQAAHRERARQ